MTLAELLEIRQGVTAVIGSGGKTTLLRTLGSELAAAGHRVLLTTTTKLFPFSDIETLVDPSEEVLVEALAEQRLVCVGSTAGAAGKLAEPAIAMTRLMELADYVLVEADGSAGRPLKAHASHEPIIPAEVNQTVCLVGLSGFGSAIGEVVHRPEIFARLAGVTVEEAATPENIARVLRAEALADRYVFNQAEAVEQWEWARRCGVLLHRPWTVTALQRGVFGSCAL